MRPASHEHVQIYLVEPVNHDNFNYVNQQVHEIFSQCLDANCQLHEHMRVLKIKDWDRRDDNLVLNNRLTKQGLNNYWKAVDASFKFNMIKHDEFIMQSKFRVLKKTDSKIEHVKKHVREDFQDRKGHSKKFVHEDCEDPDTDDNSPDEVRDFFHHH